MNLKTAEQYQRENPEQLFIVVPLTEEQARGSQVNINHSKFPVGTILTLSSTNDNPLAGHFKEIQGRSGLVNWIRVEPYLESTTFFHKLNLITCH